MLGSYVRGRARRVRPLGPFLTIGVVIVLALAMTACGGSDNSSDSNAASTAAADTPAADTAAASGADKIVADAKSKVDALYAGAFFKEPPATSPAAQRGKNVWQISVGLVLPASVLFADAVKEAAKALDWKVTVFDAKLSPDQYQDGIRQAIADKADGIILYNIDCNLARSAIKQAKAAKIAIVGGESLDCSDTKPGDESLFDGTVQYTQGDGPTWVKAMATAQANWVVMKTEGQAKAIVFSQSDLQTGVILDEAFRKEFSTCTTCKIARTVEFTSADIGPKLQQKAEQALLQTPDANAVVVPYDDLMSAGIAPAIQSSGRKDQLHVIAGGGYATNLDLVRKNQGQDAGYMSSIPWEGYGAADTLNRVFAGQEPANSGNGIGLFDKDHNVPASGAAPVPIDFVAAYEKAWADGQG